MDRRQFLRAGAAGISAVGLSACGAPPSRPTASASAPQVPVKTGLFYPPPPSPPRVQYLATFSGEADLAPKASDFASFIVGEEVASQHLVQPYGVEMFGGCIYVVDTAVPGIVVFDLAAQRMRTLLGAGGGTMKRPINVTIAADGTKYVCDTGRDQVLVYDRDDTFVTAFGAPEQFRPVDCAINGELLYVVDIAHHQVQVLDRTSGIVEFAFGKAGSALGELFHPTNLAINAAGDVFVVETSNFRVQRFSARGEALTTYGSIGDGPGHFARPKGIAIDRTGHIYVGDSAFQNVQVFDDSGQLLMSFGQPEGSFSGLNLPAAVAIDYDDLNLFQGYLATGFQLEHVVLVTSQFGPNKVDVFGYGTMRGYDYSPLQPTSPPATSRQDAADVHGRPQAT